MRPYTIYWDKFNHKHGGVRALYSLTDELLKRGMRANIKTKNIDKESIVIYPEVIKNNPAQSLQTVHWLLNKQDIKTEGMIFAWENGMGNYPLLTVNIIELNIWLPHVIKTGGVGYWVGKGRIDRSILPENAKEISRSNFNDRKVLANFIASLDYLISFDPFSAINIEAAICNTPVIICSDNTNWSKDEIIKHGWVKYGIGWGFEELDYARSSVWKARDHYESFLPIFDKRIDDFIELTQKQW